MNRPSGCWVLLDASDVPEPWRGRGRPLVLVHLFPDEAETMLRGEPVQSPIAPRDAELARLVALGRSGSDIARELGLSQRTVERRLSALRRQFELDTKSELAAFLAGVLLGQRDVRQEEEGRDAAGGAAY